ncbi:MAG: GHKL domain-containing protein [Methylococcaceae bacterium]|nr:MAG: GHKL domain-containing protein [Methylococcaceae bacterium]
MITIDIRTTYIIVALLYLILPTVAWIVLAGQQSRAVVLWCGGGLLTGVGFGLIGLRGNIPDWVSYAVANLALFVATLLRAQSLRLDLAVPWRARWMALAALAFIVIFECLRHGRQDELLRLQFVFSVWAALLLHLAALAVRIGRAEHSRSALWIARAYLLVILAVLYRMFSLLAGRGSNILASGPDTQLLGFSLVLAAVVGHFGYVGLALDRSMRREIDAAAARARAEESHRLGERIAQWDRRRSLGEMSASLGHELNQPLTAILTNAQVARRGIQTGRFDKEQLLELIDKIAQNTQRASRIIERIRDFIRPMPVRRESVELGHVVREVAELVADEAKSRKVAIYSVLPECRVWVSGDPIQLSQIVLNVLRNAIEAVALVSRREVHVDVRRQDERALLSIRDSGLGLAPEVMAKAGTPFFTTKPEGLGVGLSISRTIAEQHGGKLTIGNAEDGGALVELALPLLPVGTEAVP